ncbi:MAG: 50S ribosomal protein L32 [Chloroflexi bacterium]|nr:50S ribosomal protein L32 [Chloroflexota bacterium]MBT17840.1 50S ribosomal protein L32 [Dehalococcoidia bacterium]
MPPLPKRKRSKASSRSHRASGPPAQPNIVECPHCHKPMRTHRVCPSCGFYRGRNVLGVESDLS